MCAIIEPGDPVQAVSGSLTPAQFQHRRCFACGAENPSGLHLCFVSVGDDEIECSFVASRELQGYDGVLQGGLVTTLLDSAMTNVLLQRNIAARTAQMEIRFRYPVPVGKKIAVRGRLEESRGRLHVVSAEIVHGRRLLAEARGKFIASGRSAAEGTSKQACAEPFPPQRQGDAK